MGGSKEQFDEHHSSQLKHFGAAGRADVASTPANRSTAMETAGVTKRNKESNMEQISGFLD